MPTISVVIPAYNAKRTILETIYSVQQQTFSDFELIIINDGSTDQTLEILESVTDQRLKIFSYENGGLPVARNRGIARAIGEYIAFLDADDLWTPDKLELQLAALQQHPEAGVAYSWTYFMDEGKPLAAGASPLYEGNVYAQLLLENFIASGSNVLVRKQAIASVGEFDPTLKSCEDWDYWLRLAAHWAFVVVPKHQIIYRRASGAMSSKVNIMEKYLHIVIDRAVDSMPPEIKCLKNQSLSWGYQYLTDICLRYSTNISGVNQAGQKLWMAIRLQPQILLQQHTQSLLKWFIKRWLILRFPILKKYRIN